MSAIVNLFYLYDPWFFHFFRMAFFCGIVAFFVLAWHIYQKKQKEIRIPIDGLTVIMALLCITLIPLFIHRSNDDSVLLMYIKLLILYLFGIVIYHVFYQQANGKEKLVRDLKFGIGIQFIIGFFALSGISFFIDLGLFSHVVMPKFYGSEQEYRLYNLTSSAFFQLSLFYLFLLHFLLAYDHKENTLSPMYLFLLLCIGLISGRTFLLLSVISIAVYFKRKYIPAIIAFWVLIFTLAFTMPENKYVAHALEPLINLINGSGRLSSSTDTLMQNHLFMPTLKQFLIGEGFYFTEQGRYYGSTDSGFLRQILYGGIIYLTTCALLTFYFVRKIAVNWFNGSWKFILSTCFILTVCHVKADTYAFPGIMSVFLLFLSLFGNQGKKTFFLKGKNHV